MRILFHHRTQGQGVERVHIMGMVNAFLQAGHQVEIVSPPGVAVSHQETLAGDVPLRPTKKIEAPSRWKLILRFLPGVLFELMELFYNLISYRQLKKQVEAQPFDMIYERYAFLHFAGAWIAKKNKIPFFLEINFTCDTPLYRKRSLFIRPIQKKIEEMIFKKADGLIVVSKGLKAQLIKRGISPDKIAVTPNAVDDTFLVETNSGEAIRRQLQLTQRQVVGFVGGFYPWHGLDLLIAVLPDIAREIPNVSLLLIGDGPLQKILKEEVHRIGMDKSVIFTGQVPHKALPQYIAAFDLGIMPDSNDYGSPMKIYEYMALGKPVVAPRLPPLEEGIMDGEVGLLFPKRNREAFTMAILMLLNDKERRQKMGEAAHRHVQKNHTWKKNAEVTLDLLQRVSQYRHSRML
jgi:glycosyltransferase involved in cell wall biosynthesis